MMPRGQREQLTPAICLSTHLGLKRLASFSLLTLFAPPLHRHTHTHTLLFPFASHQTGHPGAVHLDSGHSAPRWHLISVVSRSYGMSVPAPGSQFSGSTHVPRSLQLLFYCRMMNRGAPSQLACLQLFTHTLNQNVPW